jgi:hypothetical protein
LAPRSDASEFTGPDGRFHFDVRISLPIGGLLVHYRGWLEPDVYTAPNVAAVPVN